MKDIRMVWAKSRVILFLTLIFILGFGCSKDDEATVSLAKPGVYDVSIRVDTLERWFKAIVPSGYNPSERHALLLAYHGGNLSMGFMYNNRKDLIDRCEMENWILVFPNGANYDDNKGAATWNAIHCCDPARHFNVDDIGFTRGMIDTLNEVLSVDQDRIYAIGGSNGGMLIHRIAVEMPEIFAAVAENQGVAGGRPDTTSQLIIAAPEQPIPFILIHGQSDQKVKFQGGWSASLPRYDIPFSESVGLWARNNNCEVVPDTTETNGLNGKVWIIDYNGCENNADIRAIVIENKGHGWPGLEESGFDGTNASIDFLKAHKK
jgi:polyhydroxybutyrate depolymerase